MIICSNTRYLISIVYSAHNPSARKYGRRGAKLLGNLFQNSKFKEKNRKSSVYNVKIKTKLVILLTA